MVPAERVSRRARRVDEETRIMGVERGPRSGEYDPVEFGEVKARVATNALELGRAREDRRDLFKAVEAVANAQASMVSTMEAFMKEVRPLLEQCGTCKLDQMNTKRDVQTLQKELGTDTFVRKVAAAIPQVSRQPKPWEMPIGELAAFCLVGALKMVGTGMIIYLIVLGVTNAKM